MESTIQSTQTFSSVSDSERTPLEEYKFVRQLEAEERSRRIEDVNGEFIRKQNAHKVSEMFGLNTRPTWFQEGSSYFFEIIKHARQSGNNILQFSQAKASQMTSDLSNFAGRKGYEASEILRANIDTVSNKGIENAYALKDATLQKASEVTLTISDKAGSTAYDANTKIREKLDDTVHSIGAVTNEGAHKAALKAGELSQTALEVAKEQMGNASTIAHNTALKVRSVSASFLGKFNEALNNISYNTHMAYLSLQENTEKAYRLNSDNEVYAILNGLMVSNLIKDLGYEFYRPTSEPSRLYSTRLLEKYESTSRMGRDVTGPAINNAKAISKLIEQKFHSATSITAVDSTVVPTPALIAAKADVVSEIKHNVPTAPTLTPMGANM